MPRTTYVVTGIFQLEGPTCSPGYIRSLERGFKDIVTGRTGSQRVDFEIERVHEERIVQRELGLSREEKEHLLRGIERLLATDSMASLSNVVEALCDSNWETIHRMIAEIGVAK